MRATLMFIVVLALAACSEKPQQRVGAERTPAWQGAKDPFVVSGWKAGDKASWEQQLAERANAQNEYRRIGTTR